MASNQHINKVVFGGQTLVDLSPTTAVETDVVSGKTFFKADGSFTTGTKPDNTIIIDADETAIITTEEGDIIPWSAGATNIVQGNFTTGSTRNATGSFEIDYKGSGYPIALMIYVKGGPYNSDSSTGNTTWYSSLNRYDVGFYSMVKARVPNTPTYDTSGADNYGTAMITYKNSTSSSRTYTRAGAVDNNVYTSSSTVAENSTKCVKFKGDGKTVSYYVGNLTSSTIGFPPSTEFSYIAIYSS